MNSLLLGHNIPEGKHLGVCLEAACMAGALAQ